MVTIEHWRPIPGFENAYQVSDMGNVRSLDREIVTKSGVRKVQKGRILKLGVDRHGYQVVTLGRGNFRKVHKLVLEAFVGSPAAGERVCHWDNNPGNNSLGNLRYGSQSDNLRDQVRHGTHPHASKTHCPHGHEYSSDNTYCYTRPDGRNYRLCRTCHLERGRQVRLSHIASRSPA